MEKIKPCIACPEKKKQKKQKEKMVLMGDAALLSCVAQQVRLCNCCRALITCSTKVLLLSEVNGAADTWKLKIYR